MLLTTILTAGNVEAIVIQASRLYDGNVVVSSEGVRPAGHTRNGRNKLRFTLRVRDSHAYGARRSWSGRHMPAASWEAHRDVMRAIYASDPAARFHTALADYDGADDFEARFPQTAYKNVGSQFQPAYMPDLSVEPD